MKSSGIRSFIIIIVILVVVGGIAVAIFGPRIMTAFGFRDASEQESLSGGDGRPLVKAPPSDCLFVAEAADIETFCSRLGEIAGVFDEEYVGDKLRLNFGRLIGNPEFSGVSLENPIRFYLMDPKKYPQPWAFQFSVSNEALARAAFAVAHDAPDAFFRVDDGLGTWALGARTGETIAEWRHENPGEFAFGISGQLRIFLDVERIMGAYEEDIQVQIPAMKERMATAMERIENENIAAANTASAQKELDTVMSLLHQIDTVSIGIAMKETRFEAAMDVKPLPGTGLSVLTRSHPPATANLLKRCPADAVLVMAQNLSAMDALKRLVGGILNFPGIRLLGEQDTSHSGQVLAALFLPAGPDDHASVLELRGGDRAEDAVARWKGLAAPCSEDDDRPIRIVPVEITNADETPIQLADVVCNEPVLGERGTNMIHQILGPTPQAVLSQTPQSSVFFLGSSPLARVGEVLSMDETGETALTSEPAFADVLEAAGPVPNLLVYVAPSGVRGWLGLAGLNAGPVCEDEEGLAGWVSLGEDGLIRAQLRVPTAALQRALFYDAPPSMTPTPSDPVTPSPKTFRIGGTPSPQE